MRYLLSCILLGLLTFGLCVNEASAGRFGGGRSFGVQRSHSSLFSQRATSNTRAFSPRTNTNRWGSMLGGLVVGGLLASLFMGHGLGAGLLSWLMLGSLAFIIFGFLRQRIQPAYQSTTTNPFRQANMNASSQFNAASPHASTSAASYPSGFDVDSFLRSAKVTFIRLQTAYDQKNLQDLVEFTAPDVFAEIKMQLDERSEAVNITETRQLEAQLLDISNQAQGRMASVRFTGLVKENNAPEISFDEIWHFRQFRNNSTWVVAGLQQEVLQPS